MALITPANAARIAGVTTEAVRQAQQRGAMKDISIDDRPFVDAEDLHEWMKSPRFKARGPAKGTKYQPRRPKG